MELNTKQNGNLTELQCLAKFAEYGLTVAIPYGDCARYDFVLEINNKLYKVQCKTSSLKKEYGVYEFSCRSCKTNSSGNTHKSYTEDEVDFFCTMINDKCYLIPFAETSARSKTLRFIPPKNGQKVGVSHLQKIMSLEHNCKF